MSLLQFKVKTDLFTPLTNFLLKLPFSKWYKHDITKHSAAIHMIHYDYFKWVSRDNSITIMIPRAD